MELLYMYVCAEEFKGGREEGERRGKEGEGEEIPWEGHV